ncbi:hypothetical protein Tco_0541011 [Tanacetum coccineum]
MSMTKEQQQALDDALVPREQHVTPPKFQQRSRIPLWGTTSYVVPTGRVVVPTSRYVVPAGKVIIIVSSGRLSLVPTGRALSPGRVK